MRQTTGIVQSPLTLAALGRSATVTYQPKADAGVGQSEFRFWPTGDRLHPLNAHSKPDAQGAAAKVSFAALYSPVARPAFGQKLTFMTF